MRLTDLNPRWVDAGGEGITTLAGDPVPARHGIGMLYDCPCEQCGVLGLRHVQESDRRRVASGQ